MKNKNNLFLSLVAWACALGATLGSLYFSEIAHFPPCTLCWYQRIAIYPLVFIIPLAIIRKDTQFPYSVLSVTIPGLLVSAYHNLLYYGLIPEQLAPCTAGVSCTTKYIEWFGFVTIPLLSLLILLVITLCMVALIRNQQNHE